MNSKISYDRIQNFLSSPDIDTSYIQHDQYRKADTAIKIKNGTFKWLDENEKPQESPEAGSPGKEMGPMRRGEQSPELGENKERSPGVRPVPEIILNDINMEVKTGSFVAILGE